MVSVLEDSTAAAANQQLQDMLNNAITDPDKFRNLSIRVKVSHVGKNINEISLEQCLIQRSFFDIHEKKREKNVPISHVHHSAVYFGI